MNEQPTHLDLFSGIAGFAIAAQCSGFRTVAFVEKNPFCQKLLSQHWPSIPIYGDICQFGGRSLGPISLLTGGFPCQPFSQAGDQRGKDDDRYLWPEMFRVIQTTEPDWIVGENVDGLDGLGLDDCISDLEGIGYEVAPPLEIPACAVDAKHRRNRIWIIANRQGVPRARREAANQWRKPEPHNGNEIRNHAPTETQPSTDANGLWESQPERIKPNERGRDLHSPETARGATADAAELNGRSWNLLEASGEWRALLESGGLFGGGLFGDGVHPGWQPAPEWFEREPRLARLVHGVPNQTHRLEATGNAIVPQVAFQIIKAIRAEIDKAAKS